MLRDDGGSIKQPDRPIVGDESERALDVVGRDRVDVGVEANEGGLVDEYGLDQISHRDGIWHRQKTLLFLGEAISDRALGKIGVHLLVRDFIEEDEQLTIALLDVVDVAASEESIAEEADLSFDTALFVAPVGAAEAQLHVHRAAKTKQQGMKSGGVTVPFEHDNLGVVEEPLARDTAEIGARSGERSEQ